MIVFDRIRWKNFLSTGNNFTEVNFQDAQTNLILGTNGSGKSTILDALTFSLYNKPFRKINKPQLVNSVNEKECLVEVEFSIGSREYKVIRGIRPNIFEIWVDGKVQDQDAAAADQQKKLEESILKLNYKSFTQTVILGSATFVPFMQLTSSNRRDIVEDLLDIKIFSTMSSILKDRMRRTNELIREFSIKKDMIEDKIEMQENFIKDIEKSGRERIQKKESNIESLDGEIVTLTEENESLMTRIDTELKPKLENLNNSKKTLKKLNTIKAKLEQKIQNLVSEHQFFQENSVCPTCTQSIEEQFRLDKIVDIEENSKELNDGYKELEEAINVEQEKDQKFLTYSTEINRLNNDISTNNVKVTGLNRQIRTLRNEVQEITNQIQNRNSEKCVLEGLVKDLSKTEESSAQEREQSTYYEFAHSLMKDGGVKSKIIKKYLPVMNQQINKYLQMMDFYINFTLDEEFKEVIKSPVHEDFSYESFSEGEKMRIDLALLFTWRDIAKMRNSASTNLLILDEIFDSSLDDAGTEFFTKIIRYVIQDAHVFVISHKTDGIIDQFDKVMRFDKVKGFSKLL
jgi:DNA repair exonuclease SbcCD ATPase subunit|tara:strand:+ start:1405 stop:3120 length:1716 start_codon:yes stop_codon:yes gene_type:complete